MPTAWAFDNTENKHSLSRRKNYIKKFCFSLEEDAPDVINFEKKKIWSLTEIELKSHQDSAVCYICRKKITQTFAK